MISIKKFLEYVVNTSQNIIKSENIKQIINSHERCEPYAIFSRLDREDKGYLIKEDFIRFLKDNKVNIEPQRKTIDLFIEYYDKNFDEKLDFTEFLNFILNKSQNLCRSITSQRDTYKIACNEYLDKSLENLLVQCLMNDFYLFEYIDTKKIEIFMNLDPKEKNCNEDTKLIDLFIDLDQDKDGLISCEDLYEFASKRKIKICNEELQNFIGLFDEDTDGFLDWNEFIFMILPSSLSFEYNLDSLKKQEENYNQFYYQSKCCCNNNSIINKLSTLTYHTKDCSENWRNSQKKKRVIIIIKLLKRINMLKINSSFNKFTIINTYFKILWFFWSNLPINFIYSKTSRKRFCFIMIKNRKYNSM